MRGAAKKDPDAGAGWGEPGSFLLPRTLREQLDDRVLPPGLHGYLPTVPSNQPLRIARMPDGWVYLPAVARELREEVRTAGLDKVQIGPVPDAPGTLARPTPARSSPKTVGDVWHASGYNPVEWLKALCLLDSPGQAASPPPETPLTVGSGSDSGVPVVPATPDNPPAARSTGADPASAVELDKLPAAFSTADQRTPEAAGQGILPGAASPSRQPYAGLGGPWRAWGSSGAPLLPWSVRRALPLERVPPDASARVGLPKVTAVRDAVARKNAYLPGLAVDLAPLLRKPEVREQPALGFDLAVALGNDPSLREQILRRIDDVLRFPAARERLRSRLAASDDLTALDRAKLSDLLDLPSVGVQTTLTLTVGTEQLFLRYIPPGQLVPRGAAPHPPVTLSAPKAEPTVTSPAVARHWAPQGSRFCR